LVALLLLTPLSSQASVNSISFAKAVGSRAAAIYCKGAPITEAFEKGTLQAALDLSLPMSQLDKIDLENENASLALIEALFDVSIDQCPQRA